MSLSVCSQVCYGVVLICSFFKYVNICWS